MCVVCTDNLDDREGQPGSTPVHKYYITWTTQGVRCYPDLKIKDGLYRGPLFINAEGRGLNRCEARF